MQPRYLFGIPLVFLLVAGSAPVPFALMHLFSKGLLPATAHAESAFRNLLDRLSGRTLPEGIFRTNGRLEATQVDVAAKYPGRLADITVEEGGVVKTGQVVGRVSSPEYEAQLQAAQSNVQRAKETMAEAEALIVQRKAVLAAAKSDFERGQQLVEKYIITQQTFDERRRNYEGAEANVQGLLRSAPRPMSQSKARWRGGC
jgi:HlyD family secretion protein